MNRPVFSRLYPRMSKAMEQAGMAEHRRTLLAGLTGEVIDRHRLPDRAAQR